MKKTLLMCITLFMAFILIACGKPSEKLEGDWISTNPETAKVFVDTPIAKAKGFFSTKRYASISSLYLSKAKGMPIPHPSSELIVN